MTYPLKPILLSSLAVALMAAAALALRAHAADPPAASPSNAKAALTVKLTQPQRSLLPMTIAANGNIAAWQEAIVGTETNGLRLAEVRVNVGDVVQRGQVLAVFASDTVQADLAQAQASVAEAEAALMEAAGNARRAREVEASGALSSQQISQYFTAERSAQARLEAQRAALNVQLLRLAHTEVRAPDSGVISARSATVGAVLPAGQELFRLIRQGRLEWRAELPASELARLKPGLSVSVLAPGSPPVNGKLRMVAPTVDAQTRNGLVYVDLGAVHGVKAGMFARGEFELGHSEALTLPQSAVQLRDGFSYVLRVGPDSKLTQLKVGVGRRVGERVEITSGLDPAARVVEAGVGFLSDGDTVRVQGDSPAANAASAQ